jgi:hypothetical protein
MLSELQTFDIYIDNLRIELNEINLDSKTIFTLDMLNECYKEDSIKTEDGHFLGYITCDAYSFIQIKFKKNIIPFNELKKIKIFYNNFYHDFSYLVIYSLYNKTCIIDDFNIYILNYHNILQIYDENLTSIIESIYFYFPKKELEIMEISNYTISCEPCLTIIKSNQIIDLIIEFLKMESDIEDPSYIYILLRCNNYRKKSISYIKEINYKDKINIMGSTFYLIKNFTKSCELYIDQDYDFDVDIFDIYDNNITNKYFINHFLIFKN